MDARTNILGITRKNFEALADLGPGRSRALGFLYKAAFREGRFEPEGLAISREAAGSLCSRFHLALPQLVEVVEEEGELGTTAKALLRLEDGACIECVRIPVPHRGSGSATATLCLSSQVGCRMACAFCETGRSGLTRNLSAAEIVAQLVIVRLKLGWDISNLVFMGMGEPLDNFEAVAISLAVFLDSSGLGFAQEDLTLCTVGLDSGIRRLRGLGYKRLNLSVSLNAPDDLVRTALMPVNTAVDLASLAESLARYPQRKNFALGVNYCLIPGLNDGPGAAEGIAAFLAKAALPGRALVNLIPYNPGSEPVGRAPRAEELDAFEARLKDLGIQVKRRAPRGLSLMAACGQLGGKVRANP